MGFWFLLSAALVSLIGMVIHGFAGGKIYLGNVDQSNLSPLTKSLSLVAWHVFTLFLLVSAMTLAWVAYRPEMSLMVYPIIGVNLLGALLFIVLGANGHKHLLSMPGAYLMGGTAALAWLGIA